MKSLRYTLLPDGTSDRAFLPILTWLLRQNGVKIPIEPDWAKLSSLLNPPKKLAERITKSLEIAPCDLLFVHRDAEKESRETRLAEIKQALEEADCQIPVVCLIPVRMLEAWLLFDEVAIRRAAGNPSGKTRLNLPGVKSLENLPDPKDILRKTLGEASELSGRRLKQFKRDLMEKIILVSDRIDDFSPLRQLEAFQALENDLKDLIKGNKWY